MAFATLKRMSFLFSLLLVNVLAARPDPCEILLQEKGTLRDVIQPKYKTSELNDRLQRGESVYFQIVKGLDFKLILSAIYLQPGKPRQLVFIKQMDDRQLAQLNADLMRRYADLKNQGVLPGFDVFPLLSATAAINVFPFFEGKELCSLGDCYSGVFTLPSEPELKAIWLSYKRRLLLTLEALRKQGCEVLIVQNPGEPPHLEATRNGEPVIFIGPENVWVTVDGRFVIFDPL